MSQPAGWYPQPNDPSNVRWWDGTQWTEHTQPIAPVAPAPVRKGNKIAIAAAVLVFLGLIFMAVPEAQIIAWLLPLAGLAVGIVALFKKQGLKALSIISICLAPIVTLAAMAVAGSTMAQVATAEPFVAKDYSAIDERALAQVVKDPDGARGQKLITYAQITQFDSATGTCQFRANTAHKKMGSEWDYDHNSVYSAESGKVECADLSSFVADDLVQIHSTVEGSKSYETMIGGETIVPIFSVDSIKLVK